MQAMWAMCLFLALVAPCGDAFMHFPAIIRPSTPAKRSIFSAAASPAAPVHASALASSAIREGTRRTAEAPADPQEKARGDFELQRGSAVDILLNDYNTLFQTPCDFSIFTDDIILKDAQGFTLEGLKSYKLFFKTVTRLLSLIFSHSQVSVVLMDKYAIDKSKIKLRWRIELRSRLGISSWRQAFRGIDKNRDGVISADEVKDLEERKYEGSTKRTWTSAPPDDSPMVIEGISEYKLDAKGRIYEHSISIQYPSNPFSLAPLRELLPVRSQPGFAGVAGSVSVSNPQDRALVGLTMMASSTIAAINASPVSGGTEAMAPVAMRAQKDQPGGFLAALLPKQMQKKIPKQCKEDYDCNPGGYNFPLICADFIVARFCIDPDDWRGGGLGALAWDPDSEMAKEAIPVRKTDGYTGGGYEL